MSNNDYSRKLLLEDREYEVLPILGADETVIHGVELIERAIACCADTTREDGRYLWQYRDQIGEDFYDCYFVFTDWRYRDGRIVYIVRENGSWVRRFGLDTCTQWDVGGYFLRRTR